MNEEFPEAIVLEIRSFTCSELYEKNEAWFCPKVIKIHLPAHLKLIN